MKKILLSGLLGVFLAGAPMFAHADTPIAYNVILKVLQLQEFRDQLDTDAILAKMYDNEDRSLAYVANVCNQVVPKKQRPNCENLIRRIYKEQQKYVTLVNSDLNAYIGGEIKPNKNRIMAISEDDADYFAAEILLPDDIDLSNIPTEIYEKFKHQVVIFRKTRDFISGNYFDQFWCAPSDNGMCYRRKVTDECVELQGNFSTGKAFALRRAICVTFPDPENRKRVRIKEGIQSGAQALKLLLLESYFED